MITRPETSSTCTQKYKHPVVKPLSGALYAFFYDRRSPHTLLCVQPPQLPAQRRSRVAKGEEMAVCPTGPPAGFEMSDEGVCFLVCVAMVAPIGCHHVEFNV